MQQIAMGWLVYRLTNSPFMLGVVGFSSQIPIFILSPFAGVIADRGNRHRIIIVTQILAMAQALTLALLTFTGAVQVWQVIVLGIFLGCISALDIPTRHSFVVEMVEGKEDLSNAIALNSLIFNAARLIGPSIAGILIALAGEGVCFLLNGISYLAVIVSLVAMKIKPRQSAVKHPHVLKGLKEGFLYSFGFVPIRMILLLLGMMSLMGASYVVLLPIFAKDILKGGPSTLGFLMASAGIGALVATAYIASRKNVLGLEKTLPVSAMIFALGLAGFALSRNLTLSFLLLAAVGFGFMANMAVNNTILQTITDDDKRGRVMSFYTASFMGMSPLGSLFAGMIASRIGAANTLIIGGLFCILAALAFAGKMKVLRDKIHPIYRRIGIIPEVSTAIDSVTTTA